MWTQASQAEIEVSPGKDGKIRSGRRRSPRVSQVVVCLPADGGVYAVHASMLRSGPKVKEMRLTAASEGARLRRQAKGGCLVIGVVPKSLYLSRTLEVPKVRPAEVPQMLKLEVGAYLPPEFGTTEVSYRAILPTKEGYERYEAYIARRVDLEAYLAQLARVGLCPEILLPSGVAWSRLLERVIGADLLVARLGADQLEAASRSSDQTIHVRSIATGGPNGAAFVKQALIEYVRPLLARTADESGSISIGWLCDDCPTHLANGRMVFRRPGEIIPHIAPGEQSAFSVSLTLRCFAEALLAGDLSPLQAANLMPAELVAQERQRSIRHTSLLGAFLVLMSCMLTYAAMKVAIHRYEARVAELSKRIRSIQKEGEAVGWRLEQLRAIRAARATRNDFARVIEGLYESAPEGLSYSSVELNEAGQLRLQGQADSLALAFLLPERLAKHGRFAQVQPGDAARSKRGEGTIAEFRTQCRLNREGQGK